MSKKSKNSAYYQDWLTKAKRDLETAFLNHRHGGYTDTTCYFCHQVVEKALKAYLLAKGIQSLPKIHDLSVLLSSCQKRLGDFSEFKNYCQVLNQYYLEVKYPSGIPADYPKEEAQEALKMTEEILEFVKKKIIQKT